MVKRFDEYLKLLLEVQLWVVYDGRRYFLFECGVVTAAVGNGGQRA